MQVINVDLYFLIIIIVFIIISCKLFSQIQKYEPIISRFTFHNTIKSLAPPYIIPHSIFSFTLKWQHYQCLNESATVGTIKSSQKNPTLQVVITSVVTFLQFGIS